MFTETKRRAQPMRPFHQRLIEVCPWLANCAWRRRHPHPSPLPSRERGCVGWDSSLILSGGLGWGHLDSRFRGNDGGFVDCDSRLVFVRRNDGRISFLTPLSSLFHPPNPPAPPVCRGCSPRSACPCAAGRRCWFLPARSSRRSPPLPSRTGRIGSRCRRPAGAFG